MRRPAPGTSCVSARQALMPVGCPGNGKTVPRRPEEADKHTSLDAVKQPGVRVTEDPGGLNEKFARKPYPERTETEV